ncbi:MAG: DNA polymerase III subunit gamma/tau [Xanthobacteraceae bacterium]|nr:DNA polymerase III subunit gamma/tau [Xanthobacteraceae bacterium]
MDDTPHKNAAEGASLFGEETGAYRVLARKYRPRSFDDLIGQEAMVRTLSNAFASGRIAQAYLLTGVRGVGKTTTARILARALNYEPKAGKDTGPTLDMPELGKHCQEILESRHVDVIEMDAASHNSVEDIRQINDAVRYTPVSARYKVYILDEVHMLSGAAFNALLKTLEEPPAHAKFIFATTEVRKVPVTILSRCQRFDLRRVDADTLTKHLGRIAEAEKIDAEPEGLALIARAAEGSVRDSLSLLDQAIAHGGASVKAAEVREMLGLADRTRIIDLFESLMSGNIQEALKLFREQYDLGADPVSVLTDLAEFSHLLTRFKVVPSSLDDTSLVEAERKRGKELSERLSIRVLSRAWQMLSKGISESATSGKPVQAAEMVLVRLAYAADLPTPDEALKMLGDGGGNGAGTSSGSAANVPSSAPRMQMAQGAGNAIGRPASRPAAAPDNAPQLQSLEDVYALAEKNRDLQIKLALKNFARLVKIEEGRLEISLDTGAPLNFAGTLGAKLSQWAGRRWVVIVSRERGAETLAEKEEKSQAQLKADVRQHPAVQAVLNAFPGAEITAVRRKAASQESENPAEGLDAPIENDEE